MAIFGQDFLIHPDLFPEPESGERWGDVSLLLKLAGNCYRVTGLSRSQANVIRERFTDVVFRHTDTQGMGSADMVSIGVFRTDPTEFRSGASTTTQPRALETQPLASSIRVVGHSFKGLLHWFPKKFVARIWTCESAGLAFRLAFENFFRLVVAYNLTMQGALLVHAAAVANGMLADVFIGRSGYGKSTISRLGLKAGGTVLSDDMVALGIVDNRLQVRPLPFTGDLEPSAGLQDLYPVRSLLWLNKADRHSLSRLSRAQALIRLMVCAPYVNTDPYRCEQLTTNAYRLSGGAPAFTLTFAQNEHFRDLLDEHLGTL